MRRTITVASQKGGVGKTTTAVNLAASLCLAGYKVLLLDLDPQANATSGVGLGREAAGDQRYLAALLDGKALTPFIRTTRMENLSILPSSPEASDLEIIQNLIAMSPVRLRRDFGRALEGYHYLLIDCPPTLTGPPTIALHLSDSVIIPVQCEYYAMEGLSQSLPIVKKIQERKNKKLTVAGLLLTMFSPELELAHDVVDEISTYFKDLAFKTIVPRDVNLAEAASHGLPVIQYAPASRGAWSYVELAREVMDNG